MRFNKKRAFSIIEAMIALTILSIVIASSAQFLSKKSTNVAVAGVDASHGRFECWRGKDGKVKQALYVEDRLVGKIEEVNECKFDPPADAVKLNVFAVGAGGAGGGIGEDFIDSFKDETTTGVFDVRNDANKPDGLNFTSTLGSTTQSAVVQGYPSWFKYDYLNSSKNSKAFNISGVGCGGAGGDGGYFEFKENEDIDCVRNKYSTNGYKDTCENNCSWTASKWFPKPNVCTTDEETGVETCVKGQADVPDNCVNNCYCQDSGCSCICTYSMTCCFERSCSNYKCIGGYYKCEATGRGSWTDKTDSYKPTKASNWTCPSGSCASSAKACASTKTPERTAKDYVHTFYGGLGGSAPDCVFLSKIITSATTAGYSCTSSGRHGKNVKQRWAKPYVQLLDGTTNGTDGRTCYVNVGNQTAASIGGKGGLRYYQTQAVVNKYLKEKDEEAEIVLHRIALWKANDASWELGNGATESYDFFLDSSEKTGELQFNIIPKAEKSQYLCSALPDFDRSMDGANRGNGAAGTEYTPGGKRHTGKSGDYYWGVISPGTKNHADGSGKTKGKVHGTTGIYNYKYSWSDPKGTKFLGYGEAGQPGQFIQTTIETKNAITITPGVGGQADSKTWNKMTDQKRSASGSDTVIKYGISSLVAKGGQGGIGNFTTERFELCSVLDSETNPEECNKEKDTSSIIKAQAQPSMFYSMYPAIGNNEQVINAELGQGAAGAQGVSPNNIMHGLRTIINISAHKTDKAKGKDHLTVYQEGESEYPSNFNCKSSTNSSNITSTKCDTNLETATQTCANNRETAFNKCTDNTCVTQAYAVEASCLTQANKTYDTCVANESANNFIAPSETCLKNYYANEIKTQNVSELQGGHGGVVITW